MRRYIYEDYTEGVEKSTVQVVPEAERRIPAELLMELYASEPWWPERTLDDITYILSGNISVGVWDGQKLVGFARAVSDSRFRAYIEDVLLLEEYRSKGTGKLLMQTILDQLSEIHTVTLFCQPKLSNFYTELGFKEFTRQVVMHMRNIR